VAKPDPEARFRFPDGSATLSRGEEIITYAARNLEPYRGFHIFMRAVPELLKRRPRARIVIVGGDDVSYSPRLPEGQTYRRRMLAELEGKIDWSRVHMLPRLAYPEYLSLLRVSSAHVYLTYPFIASWSMMEAMAAECLVIASRVPPVEEVITDGKNGLLVDFFSPEGIAARVDEALRAGPEMDPIRRRARQTIVERYDLKRVCLPAQARLIEQLGRGETPAGLV
jgi:glycosyltransferase involved in cell wall biosynthesis